MLKGILFFSTLGFFAATIYAWQEEGFHPILIGVMAYLALNFWFILGAETDTEEKSYLGLFLERLKLEQQAKIDKLKSDAK